jgi:hypothetical protein
MQHTSREILEAIRDQVIASFKESEGSIMYLGSKGNVHYFKAKASRRVVEIEY